MTKRQWVGLIGTLVTAGVAVGQTPGPGERGGTFSIAIPAPTMGGQDVVMYRAGGAAGPMGENVSFIASEFGFEGGVVKKAPYSAQAVTETTQTLADGNRISHKTTASLYRDSEGRTRREETITALGPWSSNGEAFQTIFINDPVTKTSLVLNTQNKEVEKMTTPEVKNLPLRANMQAGIAVAGGFGPATAANRTAIFSTAGGPASVTISGAAGAERMAAFNSDTKTEQLAAQTIEGVRAEGSRTTVVIPAGSIGNDLPINIVSERWYSPELQTVVMTKRSDPRTGETAYRLTNLSRNEPERSLFEAPADYTVVDQQQLKRNMEVQFRRAFEEKTLQEKAKD